MKETTIKKMLEELQQTVKEHEGMGIDYTIEMIPVLISRDKNNKIASVRTKVDVIFSEENK